jgi:thiol-disulfide isomerase/thioredoxin
MKLWILVLLCATAGCAPLQRTGASDPPERGWVGRGLFRTPAYHAFAAGLDTSTVEDLFVPLIRMSYAGERVIIIFGPWCGDSKREVPKFLKLADAAEISVDSVRLYAVDRTKTSDDGITERYHLEKVPTFIFESDGREVGRIVETPKTTMAADVLEILAGARSTRR